MRKIFVDKRIITFISAETNFFPIQIDLDKLSNIDDKVKNKFGANLINMTKEISLLNSEEKMAEDIKKDFQKLGWRLVIKENEVS